MAATETPVCDFGLAAPDFDLPDPDGNRVALSDFAGKPLLVMFLSNHCPFVKNMKAELGAFSSEFGEKGLAVVGIQSNDVANYPEDAPGSADLCLRFDPAGFYYLVMELLDGSSLYDLNAKDGPLAPGRALRILKQVASALARAHEIGVVHRDLKAENVMIVDLLRNDIGRLLLRRPADGQRVIRVGGARRFSGICRRR